MITRFVPQRADGDCGVASLAMAMQLPYEDVFAAAGRVEPRSGRSGLHGKQLLQVARVLKVTFRMRRKWNAEQHDGVLGIVKRATPRTTGHWVALLDGIIFDPNGEVAYYDDYFQRSPDWKPTCLLTDS